MYHCQLLERQVAIWLSTVRGPGPLRQTRRGFESALDARFASTFGQLLKDSGTAGLSKEDVPRFSAALQGGNWLAHGYFWDRAAEFMTNAGRARMLAELQDIISEFSILDSLLTTATRDWCHAHGMTDAMIEAEMAALISNASW
jgi:hypothetical protein